MVKKEKIVDPGNEGSHISTLLQVGFFAHGTKSYTDTAKTFRSRKPAIPVPAASQSDEDPCFEITIIGPKNETAQFKTRGKHPVRKVLAAACKTFGIKYERCVVSIILFCLSLGLPFHCNSASPPSFRSSTSSVASSDLSQSTNSSSSKLINPAARWPPILYIDFTSIDPSSPFPSKMVD
jgi:hypothetical protein